MNLYYNISLNNSEPLDVWHISKDNIHTCVDLLATNVYGYCSGVVLAVGKVNKHYCVTVQYDVFNLLRYDHLISVSVHTGDVVQAGTVIGVADRYVRFEYATKEQGSSKWSVRVGTQTYWKQDPKGLMG